jgi:hypothetical protein
MTAAAITAPMGVTPRRKRRRPLLPASSLPQPAERLDYAKESFYWYLCYLAQDTGYCHVSNRRIGEIQKRDEDTIRRRIRKLEAAGYVRVIERPGIERQVYPLVAPLPPSGEDECPMSDWHRARREVARSATQSVGRKAAEIAGDVADAVTGAVGAVVSRLKRSSKGKLSGGDEGGMRGENSARPYVDINKSTNNVTTPDAAAVPSAPDDVPDPVVAELIDAGFCVDKAAGFVAKFGPEVARDSLDVLRYYQAQGKEIAEPGGYLAAFGRNYHAGKWHLPGGLVKQREEQRIAAQQAEEKARLEAIEAEQKRQRAEAAAARAAQEKAEAEQKRAEREARIPQNLREPWRRALETLQAKLNKPTFETHIRGITPVAEAVDAVTLGVPSSFARQWLEDRHSGALVEALSVALRRPITVRLVVLTDWLKGRQT